MGTAHAAACTARHAGACCFPKLVGGKQGSSTCTILVAMATQMGGPCASEGAPVAQSRVLGSPSRI